MEEIHCNSLLNVKLHLGIIFTLPGFARLSGESRRDLPAVNWVLPPGLPARALGGVLEIDWISRLFRHHLLIQLSDSYGGVILRLSLTLHVLHFRKDLSFNKTQHLYNPWNEGKPVKIGRDGQVC